MGASSFTQRAKGATARDAFLNATADALREYGNRGYTGSLAEKSCFREIIVPNGASPEAYAQNLLEDDEHWVGDKSGPAGCVALGDGEYLFFGWARC